MSSSSGSLNAQVSWGDQDVELPDVSGNQVDAYGALAPAISYAGCAKKNLPVEENLDLTPEEKELYQRYLSSSKFERDNFHPYNTPPERPCSAFFHLPEHFTTVKDIFLMPSCVLVFLLLPSDVCNASPMMEFLLPSPLRRCVIDFFVSHL